MGSMRAVVVLGVCAGCSLYFDSPKQAPPPDAAVPSPDAAPSPDPIIVDGGGSGSCPIDTAVTVGFPSNGATNVAQPVPIRTTITRPLDTDQVFVAWLTDVNDVPVPIGEIYDANCSTPIPTTPVDPVAWTECVTNLVPGLTYIWHVNVECYATNTIVDLSATTFTTAM